MSQEEDIRKAYLYLGLEAGTELPEILTKYKRSVMVWHPDRAPNDEKWKHEATEELKKFNWAKDILQSHFEGSSHNPAGPCACKSGNVGSTGHAGRSNTGPGRRAKTTEETNQEEAQAKAKNEERERRAASEQPFHGEQPHEEQRAAQAMHDAIAHERELRDNRLRWRIAIVFGVAYIGLCLFGYIGTGVKAWWHTFTFNWERDHAPKQEPSSPSQFNQQPLAPSSESISGINITPPVEQPDPEQVRRQQEAKKKHDQDIYFAKLDIDRYQKAIEHSQTLIPDLEAKIADPNVSITDRRHLESYRDFQQRELTKNKENLRYAEDQLRSLSADSK